MHSPSILPISLPSWLPRRAVTIMNNLLLDVFRAAGVTQSVQFKYLAEQDVLSRKHLPPYSFLYCPGHPSNNEHTLVGILTGLDARNHKARVVLTAPADQIAKLHSFLKSCPKLTFLASRKSDAVTPACSPADPAPAPEIDTLHYDDTDRALFLTEVLEAGKDITTSTAESIILRLFGIPRTPSIIADCTALDLLTQEGCLLTLTEKGELFIRAASAPLPPPPEAPTFESLRAAVITAREAHGSLQSQHKSQAAARAELEARLATHRRTLEHGVTTITKLKAQLAELEESHTTARHAVLALEEQHRALPPDLSPQLIQSERTLQEAESAYAAFIAIN